MIRSVNVCPNCDSTYIAKFIRRKKGYRCKSCKSEFKEPMIRETIVYRNPYRINLIVKPESPLRMNTKFIW